MRHDTNALVVNIRAALIALQGALHLVDCMNAKGGMLTEVDFEVGAVDVGVHRVVMIDDPHWPGVVHHGCKSYHVPEGSPRWGRK